MEISDISQELIDLWSNINYNIKDKKLLTSLKAYIYTHKKAYIKKPEENFRKENFRGQVYEASFYESLIHDFNDDDFKILAKYPYAKPREIETGFKIDKNGSCVYSSKGIPLAEFDAIIFSNEKIIFFECFISQKTLVIKEHEKGCLKKLQLLNILFPDKEVQCVVISNNQNALRRFKSKDKFITQWYKKPSINLMKLAKTNKPKVLPSKQIMATVDELNDNVSDFDYTALQTEMQDDLFRKCNVESVYQNNHIKNGLIKRVYWGKINSVELNKKFSNEGIDEVVIAIDFSNYFTPKIRYFTYNNGICEVFLSSKKPVVLNSNRPSRIELILYKKNMKNSSYSNYELLKKNVALFCENKHQIRDKTSLIVTL